MEKDDWNERYAQKELVWTAKPNRFLVEEAAGLPPGRAMDMASGEGRNAVWLAERGWRVVAVDFSDVAAAKGAELAAGRSVAEQVEFRVADLRHYELEPRAYDLVAILYLQIPQSELFPILAGAAAAVAPGGRLLVIAHDTANLAGGYGGPKDPRVLYTPSEVVAAIGGELEIEKAVTAERPVETDDGVKIALDCVVAARRA